ncbi:MAG: murein biosynthesis integral membrane protein MurJ [Angelakisella sp.]|nr:murein biosynthesis integral membrane protein MurJ [Angelakisella sp.]
MSKTATYTIILIGTTIFAKVLGFAREMTLAYFYGASAVTDAYVVAFSIPTIIFSGIGTAILTSYIAIYTSLQQGDTQKLRKFNDSVTTLIFLLSGLVLAVFLIFDQYIVRAFAVGFQGETFEMAVSLSRIMMASLLFIGVYYIIQGYLQIHGSFFAVGMVSVPLNVFVVLSFVFSDAESYTRLGWGVVAGYGFSWLMLYVFAKGKGYSYRPCFQFKDKHILHLISMVIPIFLGKTITQLNIMIDRTIASTLPEGSVSALGYGNRIIGFVTAVFVVSVATALFPQLSRLSALKNIKKLKSTFVTSVGIMSFIVLPISAGAMIFSEEIVSILFLRGAFTQADVERTAQVVVFYSIGLLAFSIKDVMLNVFYAIQDTKTPTINSVVALVINTVVNLLLVKKMAHSGLALATSISGIVTLIMLFISLRRKIGALGLRQLFISLGKMLLATVGMAFAAMPVYDFIFLKSQSMMVSLIAAVICGALVYAGLSVLLRVREMGLLVVGAYERLRPKRS